MKILHLCLSCFYIDGYNYQENVLPRINMLDGHEVKIIASTETYIDNYTLGYTEPNEYVNEDGIQVKRIPYKKIINTLFTTKIRKYKNLYEKADIVFNEMTKMAIVKVNGKTRNILMEIKISQYNGQKGAELVKLVCDIIQKKLEEYNLKFFLHNVFVDYKTLL